MANIQIKFIPTQNAQEVGTIEESDSPQARKDRMKHESWTTRSCFSGMRPKREFSTQV